MAHVAVPQNQGGVRLDHLEGVLALSWLGHLNEPVSEALAGSGGDCTHFAS